MAARTKPRPASAGTAGPATDGAEPANGRATIAHLADELLPLLIARLGASGLGELEVRQDGWRVRLRRSMQSPGDTPAQPAAHVPARGHSAPRSQPSRADGPAADGPIDVAARRERGRVAITSPGVGYYQPSDGLVVGMSVRGGDLLGHVDVLGVRQQVVAPEDGIMATLVAEVGEAVEYGQTLARLEPAEGRG
jgi:biotin carboxyl carrier protein